MVRHFIFVAVSVAESHQLIRISESLHWQTDYPPPSLYHQIASPTHSALSAIPWLHHVSLHQKQQEG